MIFAFYGSLRKDQYNNKRFDLNNDAVAIHLGTYIINGIGLYKSKGFSSYPFADKNKNSNIVVDLYDILDTKTRDMLHYMEVGAGYNPNTITVAQYEATIYLYPLKNKVGGFEFELIPDGDWTKFLTTQK